MPTQADLFDTPDYELSDDTAPQYLQTLACTFSPSFWREIVARMLAHGEKIPPTRQLIIVPDNSMILPYRAAWSEQAHEANRPYLMPPMMTLMDWAKENGAQDWDAQDTERMLNWMQVLPSASVLREALGQGVDDGDVMALSRSLIDMSDELSIHLLAGRNIAWVKQAVNQAVDAAYRRQTHQIAQQELAILLHCWQADVDRQTPVVRYLAVLQQMVREHTQSAARPYDCVWVLRNRPWTAHEQHFWHRYARHVAVFVLDIQSITVRAGLERQKAIVKIAGELSPRWEMEHLSTESSSESQIQFIRAQNLEDEAQTVVRQVLRWREQGLRKIALIALDRQVSRRVWALLRRVGVDIRDDTGWLLSTSRAASAWHSGLALLQGDVLAKDLLEWLSHPLVLANWTVERKAALLACMYRLADRQQEYQKKRLWRNWDDWLKALHVLVGADETAAYADVQTVLEQAKTYAQRWQTSRTLGAWAHEFIAWANSFGLWAALENDAAGQQWCELMHRWQLLENAAEWPFNTALQLMNAEVERLTYRPPSMNESSRQTNDVEVTLLPLGNTRLRTFDAVWLLGADAGNLPGPEQDLGLLNWAVRRDLGLPTVQDKQLQMRIALLDILALNPQVCASYAAQKDGAPNALSPWLQQYLRAQGGQVMESERIENHVMPRIQMRSAVTIAAHVPQQISATDLSSIAACPYQYHAKKVLNIAPIEWPDDEIAASDKGNVWHAVVERFHQWRDVGAPEHDVEVFMQVLDEQLDPLCVENPRYWSVKQLFASYAVAFVAWWQAREREGWQLKHSEYAPQPFQTQIITDGAGQIQHELQWRGRIDQVDECVNEHGEIQWSLIDYKTNNLMNYKKRIRDHEETQLAFYINLIEAGTQLQVVDARYVGVERHAERRLPEAHLGDATYIHTQAAQLRQQVHDVFLQMVQGAPLIALGEKGACVYCDYRALCRKDYAVPISLVQANDATQKGGV